MKRVFLYAYDKTNLGDDLFIHTITRRYPGTQFYLWTDGNNIENFACLPNLKAVDRKGAFVRFLDRVRPSFVARYKTWLQRRCDAVVYIGGSIFMEYSNWPLYAKWWDEMVENYPMYVLGANFGPYHTEEYRERLAAAFCRAKDICFRDSYSYQLFKNVPTVRSAPDILFAYPMPTPPVRKKQILVSAISCTGRDECSNLTAFDKSYVNNMASLLQQYLCDGCSLVFASFCEVEGDRDGIRKIISAMGATHDERIRVITYNGKNAEEVTTAIAESDYVIATRFHGVILALGAGRPVLPIIYSDKTIHTLEDLGFTGEVIDLRDAREWSYEDSKRNWMSGPQNLQSEVREAAREHFAKLDKLLL